jgi:hypothetical protein
MTKFETWRPLAEQLRASIPEGKDRTTLNATFQKTGSSTAWGMDRNAKLNFRDLPLKGLFGDDNGVCIQMTAHSDGKVVMELVVERPELDYKQVEFEIGSLPAAYEKLPERYPVPYSPGMNPERTRQLLGHRCIETEPVSEDRISALEKRLNVILPPDVRQLFLTAGIGLIAIPEDLDGPPPQRVPNTEWDSDWAMSVIKPEEINVGMNQPIRSPWFEGHGLTDDPKGRVQTLGQSPAWIPIAGDGGGNFFIVDLAPGPKGYMGQILFHWHEYSEKMFWFANSLTELLELASTMGQLHGEEEAIGLEKWNVPGGSRVRVSNHWPDALSLVNPNTQVLEAANERILDLEPLTGLSQLRWLSLEDGARLSPNSFELLKAFPKLEFLGLMAADWQILLEATALPATVKRAEITDGDDIGFFDRLHLSDAILATRGLPAPDYFTVEGQLS